MLSLTRRNTVLALFYIMLGLTVGLIYGAFVL